MKAFLSSNRLPGRISTSSSPSFRILVNRRDFHSSSILPFSRSSSFRIVNPPKIPKDQSIFAKTQQTEKTPSYINEVLKDLNTSKSASQNSQNSSISLNSSSNPLKSNETSQKPNNSQIEENSFILVIVSKQPRWALVRRNIGEHITVQTPDGKIQFLYSLRSPILYIHPKRYEMPKAVKQNTEAAMEKRREAEKMEQAKVLADINKVREEEGKEPLTELPSDPTMKMEKIFPITDYNMFQDCIKLDNDAKSFIRINTTKSQIEAFWLRHCDSGEIVTQDMIINELFGKAISTNSDLKHLAAAKILAENSDLFTQKLERWGISYLCHSKRYVEWIKKIQAALDHVDNREAFLDAVFDHLLAKSTIDTRFMKRIHDGFQGAIRDMMEGRKPTKKTEEPEPVFDLEKYQDYIDLLKFVLNCPFTEVIDKRMIQFIEQGLGIASQPSDIYRLLKDLGATEGFHAPIFKLQRETSIFDPYPQDMLDSITDHLPFITKENGGLPIEYRKQRTEKLGKEKGKPQPSNFSIILEDREGRQKGGFGDRAFTIDSDETTEVDDAISVSSDGWIHIHIADPTRLVNVNSDLDLYARSRGTSLYAPGHWVSLFPPLIAAGPMSINQNHHQNPCFTFSAKLAEDGSILESRIALSTLNTIKKANYEEVEEVLDKKSEAPFDPSEVSDLERMYSLAEKRLEYRKRGGMESLLSIPRLRFQISKEGLLTPKLETESKSATLVSEMMILAGEIAAKFSIEKGIEVPFRVQSEPSPTPSNALELPPIAEDHPNYNIVTALRKITSMSSASSSMERLGHFSIGFKDYVRVSSPIRRYVDIVSHYQLKAYLAGKKLPFSKEDLNKMLPKINRIEQQCKRTQDAMEKYHLRHFMKNKEEEHLDAIFIQRQSSGRAIVYIPEFCTTSFVRDLPVYNPGDTFKVRILNMDAPFFVNFEPVETMQDQLRRLSGSRKKEDSTEENLVVQK